MSGVHTPFTPVPPETPLSPEGPKSPSDDSAWARADAGASQGAGAPDAGRPSSSQWLVLDEDPADVPLEPNFQIEAVCDQMTYAGGDGGETPNAVYDTQDSDIDDILSEYEDTGSRAEQSRPKIQLRTDRVLGQKMHKKTKL